MRDERRHVVDRDLRSLDHFLGKPQRFMVFPPHVAHGPIAVIDRRPMGGLADLPEQRESTLELGAGFGRAVAEATEKGLADGDLQLELVLAQPLVVTLPGDQLDRLAQIGDGLEIGGLGQGLPAGCLVVERSPAR